MNIIELKGVRLLDVLEFGRILKALREKAGLSTHKLAEASGVSQSYISHVESGRKKNVPSPEILKKLADALEGVSYVDLMGIAGYYEEDDLLEPLEETKNRITKTNTHSDFIDLIKILKLPNVIYKNKVLSEEDRKRILDMLNVLFSDSKKI